MCEPRVPPSGETDRWVLLSKASDIWAAIAEACSKSRRRIDVEQYIVAADPAGFRLSALLAEKAREGVAVRMLVDYFGSREWLNSESRAELEAAGAEIASYNPFWRRPLYGLRRFIRRDHRKIVVSDDTAFVGSACVEARMADWRELTVRLEGPAVGEIADSFDATWRAAKHRLRGGHAPAPPRNGGIHYIGNEAGNRNRLYERVLRELSQARRHAVLCSPYLLPDRRLMSALAAARARGTAIAAVVPQHIDPAFVDAVGWTYYGRLLRMGCRIFIYAPHVLHAKAVAIDGRWATVGSMNLDRLSFRLNLEGNVWSSEPSFVSAVDAELEAMMRSSEEIDLDAWRNRPWRKKLLGALGRPLSPFL